MKQKKKGGEDGECDVRHADQRFGVQSFRAVSRVLGDKYFLSRNC